MSFGFGNMEIVSGLDESSCKEEARWIWEKNK